MRVTCVVHSITVSSFQLSESIFSLSFLYSNIITHSITTGLIFYQSFRTRTLPENNSLRSSQTLRFFYLFTYKIQLSIYVCVRVNVQRARESDGSVCKMIRT